MARTRRSAEETRELMIEAGFEILQNSGLSLGLDHVTLDAACRAKDIPRSSSHSAWATSDEFSPQEAFQRAVLKSWLFGRDGVSPSVKAKEVSSGPTVDFDDITAEEMVRAWGQEGFAQALKSDPSGLFMSTDLAIRHALTSQPENERDPEVFGWLSESERELRNELVRVAIKPAGEAANIRPRPEFGESAWHFHALVTSSMIESLLLRSVLLPEFDFTKPIPGTEDERVPTTVVGACIEAVMHVFFQIETDAPVDGETSGHVDDS